MEAKELRIGNFVKEVVYKDECMAAGYNPIKEVDRISDNGITFTDCYFQVIDLIEPIPLTEEWLVKFGFEDNDYTFDKGDFQISWGLRIVSSGVRSSFYLDGYIPESFKIKIEHIHQLQNLYFALTGEEL